MLYGTAWKRGRTSTLVVQALEAGFRGVDVAAQPRHYREDLVGEGLREVWLKGQVKREYIYLQTKFTWTSGQDLEGIPFDPHAAISTQVKSSIDASLYAFRPAESDESIADSYIDCVLLHFPLPTLEETLEAWKAMEEYVPHKVRSLGVCNTSLMVLQVLCNVDTIRIKPAVVQNRFHKSTRYDIDLREYCLRKSIWYQAFGVLKSNPELLTTALVGDLAVKLDQSKQETLYQLVLGLEGISISNGTTNSMSMKGDIEAARNIELLAMDDETKMLWSLTLSQFRSIISEDI